MKLIISTIIAGILLFLLGWIFYGILFMDYLGKNFAGLQRAPEDMKIWAIAVSCLFQGFFLSYLYPRFYKGGSPLGGGLKFGILFGLFLSIPSVFSVWATMPVTYRAAITDGIIAGIMITITGVVIGLIYGKKETEKAVIKEKQVIAEATT